MKRTKEWYKNAVIYQIHVRCFCDSNGDGIGDFVGLASKLDYVKSLGCNVIWLQPFYPSPLKDDGYDIASYCDVHPDYGTLRDFRYFLREAHRRQIHVVTELVINHTSDQHSWFERARQAKPGSNWRDYYVWSDTPDRYRDARIIFKDFESSNWAWDPVAQAYYWHRFYSHQPDLNYDNPNVHREILKVLDFWMGMGVDGMRLDAIPYLYEREGTDCENLPETHQFLKKLRKHVDDNYPDRIFLAEANQWPEQAAAYFGNDDECHMLFNFPVMPRLFMALRMEERFPIIDIMEQTPNPPPSCQWATFLRNHDELTLEMVTDEERDYMYRAYAKDPRARINLGIRRRLAPLLDNDRAKIELMNVLLFSLPGSPIIYYGDEIGMGDNYYLGDRNGVRTPMQWHGGHNAGFSEANPQRLYLPLIIDPEYHHSYLNVANQERSVSSLLFWMRHLVAVRQSCRAFGQGALIFLMAPNPKILAFIREYGEERILVVINLSRYAQSVQLHLESYRGYVVKDLFSGNLFSTIGEEALFLTLGRYGYFWLQLEKEKGGPPAHKEELEVQSWKNFLDLVVDEEVKRAFLLYLKRSRWCRAKAEELSKVEVVDFFSMDCFQLAVIQVEAVDLTSRCYLLPLLYLSLEEGAAFLKERPEALIFKVKGKGVVVDALQDARFQLSILNCIGKKKKIKGKKGKLAGFSTPALKQRLDRIKGPLSSQVNKAEQTNSSILYNEVAFLKLYRCLEEENPEVELLSYLTKEAHFSNVPATIGLLEWERESGRSITVGLLQEAIIGGGDLWSLTLDAISRYFESALVSPLSKECLLETESLAELIGYMHLEAIQLLGRRTAEMHMALLEAKEKELAPEPFNPFSQKALYQSMRGQLLRVLSLLHRQLPTLNHKEKLYAEQLASQKQALLQCFKKVEEGSFSALKIRIHGDFHLGQVLKYGKDLMIIDFEGEPALPVGERKIKRSPLQDVAGMIRSFHYAITTGLTQQLPRHPGKEALLAEYSDLWYRYVSGVYLKEYFAVVEGAAQLLIPKEEGARQILLDAFLLNKAIYEVGYELQNRPEKVSIPLQGALMLLGEKS